MENSPLEVSVFASDQEPRAIRRTTTWDELLEDFRKPAPKDVEKSDLPMWSMATFAGNYRKLLNVEAVSALTYDVDKDPVPSSEVIAAAVSGTQGFVHTSSSSTITAPRWRLVLRLSRPVIAAEYSRLWVIVASMLPFPVGQEAKDASRAWYNPRQGADGSYDLIAFEGHPLAVEALLAIVPSDPAPATAAESVAKPISNVPSSVDRRAAAAALLGSIWPPDGDRYHAHLALAGALVRGGWADEEGVTFMEMLYTAAGAGPSTSHAMLMKTSRETATPTGFKKLREMLDPAVVDAARKLMGLSDDAGDVSMLERFGAPQGESAIRIEDDPLNAVARDKPGKISFDKVVWVLSQHAAWRGVFRFNVLSRKATAVRPPFRMRMEQGGLSDGDIGKIKMWFVIPPRVDDDPEDTGAGYTVSADVIKLAVATICEEKGRSYNPFAEYLDALPPSSGELDRVHETIFGVPENPFASVLLKKTMVAAVRRVRAMPGVGEAAHPVDHQGVLMISGEQDAGKGWLVKTLAGREFYHSIAIDQLKDKDTRLKAQGSVFAELEEMSTNGAGDREALKRFLSADDDHERGAYERGAERMQRSYVMIATTNDPRLEDPTGHRRWWPIIIPPGVKIDVAAAARLRDALWAEANTLAASSFDHHLTAGEKALCAALCEGLEVEDSLAQSVEDACRGRTFVALRSVYDEITRGEKVAELVPRREEMRISDALRRLGCVRRTRDNVRGWDVPAHVASRKPSSDAERYRKTVALSVGMAKAQEAAKN